MKRMVIPRIYNLIFLLTLPVLLNSCRDMPVPKPRGYFRIDLPSRDYILFNKEEAAIASLPFTFEYPSYGKVSFKARELTQPGWFDIDFPFYNARIYLTYKNVNNNLAGLMEESYRMDVKNHITKADAIDEQIIINPDHKVYGILYDLKGSTATAVQFFVTDSTKHFLRGSLYFSAEPNPDSLAPVINFFREDMIHLVETLNWIEK
jgi:gliding motility-associated lipoprotein GldD